MKSGFVAAGTVFRVLLVWQAKTGAILHRLRGHQGVIFDTVFLHAKTGCGQGHTMIGSVSDDRTVRVWSVTEEGQARQIAEMYGHS